MPNLWYKALVGERPAGKWEGKGFESPCLHHNLRKTEPLAMPSIRIVDLPKGKSS